MFRRRINPLVLVVVLTLGGFGVVFWATWSALPHNGGALPAGSSAKLLPVELLGVLSWGISAAYGSWLAGTGRKVGDVPRRFTGRRLRWWGMAEVVLSLLAIWAILSQPANTFLYSFIVLVGILSLGIAIPLAARGNRAR
jgi:hypothetical protein